MKLTVDIMKKYGSFTLNTAFETEDMRTGLLGQSGCGKTQTLKCIAGLVTPDRGRIVLDGRVLFDSEKHINLRPQERRVGYLFQSYALFPTMNVRKNIMTGMHALKDRKEREERYESVIRLLHLEGLDAHRPSSLSGGQAQRVALARMLVGDPELLLMDEPFSALDTGLREKLQAEMKRLLETLGKQVILVTHSPQEAHRLCSALRVMKDGKIIRQGSTGEVFRDPERAEAAELLGHRSFFPFERVGNKSVRLLPSGVILTGNREIPEDRNLLSVPSAAIRAGKDVPVRTVSVLKEEDGSTLLLDAGEGRNIWWKVSDRDPEEVCSVSIDIDSCLFLKA